MEVIACVSVNDAFVMDAWGKSQGATGKIRMLADTSGEFTKVQYILVAQLCLECAETTIVCIFFSILQAVDLGFDSGAILGGLRSKRSVYLLYPDQGCSAKGILC